MRRQIIFFKFNFHLCFTRGRTRLLNILASSIWTLKTFYLWISCIHFNSLQFFWMIIFPHFPSLILSLNKPSVWSQPGHLSAYGSPHSLWHIRASLDPPENITINTQQMMGRDQRGHREISQLIKISDQDLERPCQLKGDVKCMMFRVMREEEEEGEGCLVSPDSIYRLFCSFWRQHEYLTPTQRHMALQQTDCLPCTHFSLWENQPHYGIILHNLQLF